MKRNICLLSLFLTFPFFLSAQNEWAKNIGGTNLDQGTDLVMDNQGNLFTTGFFQGTVDFDPSENTLKLTAVGERDIFIAKYNNLGQIIWAKGIGGADHDHGRGIQLDAAGNIYIAGDFNSLVDFDPDMGFSLQNSAGSSDIFIAKYNPQGGLVWAKTFGGTGIESCRDLTLDRLGNIYIAGVFQGTADFDPNGGVINQVSAGAFDAFLVKLSPDGNHVWSKTIQSPNSNYINHIVIDNIDNIIVTGDFQGTADFDPHPTNNFSMTTIGNKNAFFAKYNPQGNFIFAKMIGGSGFEKGRALAVDAQDNIYLTGIFKGMIDFDPSGNSAFISSSGLHDIFIAKYSPQGIYQWVDKIGGTGDDFATSVIVDSNNEVFVSGTFTNTITLSNGDSFTSAGSSDIVLARYEGTGDLLFARKHGGANSDEGAALCPDNQGNVYSVGWIQGNAMFGTTMLNSIGDRDVFLAKTALSPQTATEVEPIETAQFDVFPNPSNGQFTVTLTDFDAEELQISVVDVTGRLIEQRLIRTFANSTEQVYFDISNITTKGLYFVQIKSTNALMTKKVMRF